MAYILRASSLGKLSMPDLATHIEGMKVLTSSDPITEDDYAFRWGCTSGKLGKTKVINKIKAIEETADKRGFRLKMASKGVAPRSWGSFEDYLDSLTSESLTERVLVRPAYHQRSESIYDCTGPAEVFKATKKISGPLYISEFIGKEKEFRVFVVQGRIAWMIEKHPKDKSEVTWGCISEGDFTYVDWSEWPENVSKCALDAMELSDLDFGAVDIIVCEDAYALEINSAPFLTPYYTKCIAKTFKYIIKNGREHFPKPQDYSWKSVIHPAVQIKDIENV